MASPRRRKPARRVRWRLPTVEEATRFAKVASIIGGIWWAGCNPDPRTAAVASLAVTGAETDVAMADSLAAVRAEIASMNRRLGRVERALHLPVGKGTEREHASPAPAQRGITGWLSRWLGHKDRR